MFNRTPSAETRKLNEALDDAFVALTPHDDDFETIVNGIDKLARLKYDISQKSRVSPDTYALIAGNILGIVIIVGYEHAHPIISKAPGLLRLIR